MAKNHVIPVTQSVDSKGTDEFGYLKSAEMSVEGNYNMIGDGIINNVPKPSLLERLEEFEQRKRERHKDDFFGDKRERHKDDFFERKRERHRADYFDSREER